MLSDSYRGPLRSAQLPKSSRSGRRVAGEVVIDVGIDPSREFIKPLNSIRPPGKFGLTVEADMAEIGRYLLAITQ